jgi:hypothetical protein
MQLRISPLLAGFYFCWLISEVWLNAFQLYLLSKYLLPFTDRHKATKNKFEKLRRNLKLYRKIIFEFFKLQI